MNMESKKAQKKAEDQMNEFYQIASTSRSNDQRMIAVYPENQLSSGNEAQNPKTVGVVSPEKVRSSILYNNFSPKLALSHKKHYFSPSKKLESPSAVKGENSSNE